MRAACTATRMSADCPSFRMSGWSLRRADPVVGVLVALALALGGCMRIYQDSELPDVSARWGEPDCGGGTGNVALTLRGVDTPSTVELSVPCTEYGATFVDVAFER